MNVKQQDSVLPLLNVDWASVVRRLGLRPDEPFTIQVLNNPSGPSPQDFLQRPQTSQAAVSSAPSKLVNAQKIASVPVPFPLAKDGQKCLLNTGSKLSLNPTTSLLAHVVEQPPKIHLLERAPQDSKSLLEATPIRPSHSNGSVVRRISSSLNSGGVNDVRFPAKLVLHKSPPPVASTNGCNRNRLAGASSRIGPDWNSTSSEKILQPARNDSNYRDSSRNLEVCRLSDHANLAASKNSVAKPFPVPLPRRPPMRKFPTASSLFTGPNSTGYRLKPPVPRYNVSINGHVYRRNQISFPRVTAPVSPPHPDDDGTCARTRGYFRKIKPTGPIWDGTSARTRGYIPKPKKAKRKTPHSRSASSPLKKMNFSHEMSDIAEFLPESLPLKKGEAGKQPKKKKERVCRGGCARVRPISSLFVCARCKPYRGMRKQRNWFYFLLHPERTRFYRPKNMRRTDAADALSGKGSQGRHNSLITADLPLPIQFRLYLQRPTKIFLAKSKIHGAGVFAGEELEIGRLVLEYRGEIIRTSLIDKREEIYRKQGFGSYLFKLDDDFAVDATKAASAARFINHSCDPNCAAKVISHGEAKKIVLYAVRHVVEGEELSYNYKLPLESEKIPCLCNAPNCRKYLN